MEYWKKTAQKKDIEIQSMKINKNLDLNDNNLDDKLSQNSGKGISSPNNNQISKIKSGIVGEKDEDHSMIDLKKI